MYQRAERLLLVARPPSSATQTVRLAMPTQITRRGDNYLDIHRFLRYRGD